MLLNKCIVSIPLLITTGTYLRLTACTYVHAASTANNFHVKKCWPRFSHYCFTINIQAKSKTIYQNRKIWCAHNGPFKNSCNSSSVSDWSFFTTKAFGTSPDSSFGIPITPTSATFGWRSTSSSNSAGAIWQESHTTCFWFCWFKT